MNRGIKILGFGLAYIWGVAVIWGAEDKAPAKEEAPKELVKLDVAEEVKLGRGMAYQAFSAEQQEAWRLSLIHISEPTRPY